MEQENRDQVLDLFSPSSTQNENSERGLYDFGAEARGIEQRVPQKTKITQESEELLNDTDFYIQEKADPHQKVQNVKLFYELLKKQSASNHDLDNPNAGAATLHPRPSAKQMLSNLHQQSSFKSSYQKKDQQLTVPRSKIVFVGNNMHVNVDDQELAKEMSEVKQKDLDSESDSQDYIDQEQEIRPYQKPQKGQLSSVNKQSLYYKALKPSIQMNSVPVNQVRFSGQQQQQQTIEVFADQRSEVEQQQQRKKKSSKFNVLKWRIGINLGQEYESTSYEDVLIHRIESHEQLLIEQEQIKISKQQYQMIYKLKKKRSEMKKKKKKRRLKRRSSPKVMNNSSIIKMEKLKLSKQDLYTKYPLHESHRFISIKQKMNQNKYHKNTVKHQQQQEKQQQETKTKKYLKQLLKKQKEEQEKQIKFEYEFMRHLIRENVKGDDSNDISALQDSQIQGKNANQQPATNAPNNAPNNPPNDKAQKTTLREEYLGVLVTDTIALSLEGPTRQRLLTGPNRK